MIDRTLLRGAERAKVHRLAQDATERAVSSELADRKHDVLVLDFNWPDDKFHDALDRALADGVFATPRPRAIATVGKRASEAVLDARLDELGF